MKELTKAICDKYRNKALELNEENPLDIGARRAFRIELQELCGISEIWAINIINGHHVDAYLSILAKKNKGESTVIYDKDNDFLEWLAEKEEKQSQLGEFNFEEEM